MESNFFLERIPTPSTLCQIKPPQPFVRMRRHYKSEGRPPYSPLLLQRSCKKHIFAKNRTYAPGPYSMTSASGVVSVSALLAVALAAVLLADCTLAQTFSYSRGWKSGKRSGVPAGLGGRTAEDFLAEDLPLYRYILESRGEHRTPYEPWRLVDESGVHFARRPVLPVAQNGEQGAEHDDR